MKKYKVELFIAICIFTIGRIIAQENDKRPNILFCIADDASYPHFGATGCSWIRTPNFDKMATNGLLVC